MAANELSSLAVSAFCENMAMMLAAGIGTDEAVDLLCADTADSDFHDALTTVQACLLKGETLTDAMTEGGFFPAYVAQMIAAGERAGRTEEVLRGLAAYYASRHRLEEKLRSVIVYPLILLLLMAVILAVLLVWVLPVFGDVYRGVSGGLGVGYIHAAYLVGGLALAVTGAFALCVLAAAVTARTPAGRSRLAARLAGLPLTAGVSARLGVARLTRILAVFLASGVDVDSAMEAAAGLVTNPAVAAKAEACRQQMQQGTGLAEAIAAQQLFEPLYARMLLSGERSGSAEAVLAHLADLFDEDAQSRMDRLADAVEPALSAFLTIAVGVTLLAAMLPLAGMLGAIG